MQSKKDIMKDYQNGLDMRRAMPNLSAKDTNDAISNLTLAAIMTVLIDVRDILNSIKAKEGE